MNAAEFDYVCRFIRDESAIVLEPGKEYLVEARLQTLARREQIGSVSELIGKLRASPKNGMHRKVVEAMTTNETSFFRDLHPFEALRKTIIPELMAARASEKQLDIWCGAASTGQEPYSLLMLMAEHFPALLDWKVRFLATDLSSETLDRARAGRFSQLEVNRGLPAALLVKYFARSGADWIISEALRKRVEFREMNLVKDWPFLAAFDLVLMRNVLIYFDVDTKKAILGRTRRVLRPGGYLLLGGAETTLNLDDNFRRTAVNNTTCYRLG